MIDRHHTVTFTGHRTYCGEADEVITLAEQFHRGAYQVRNDYLVSHASYLVAWYNGSKGGTQYTFLKGLKCGLELENLATFQLLDQRLFQ